MKTQRDLENLKKEAQNEQKKNEVISFSLSPLRLIIIAILFLIIVIAVLAIKNTKKRNNDIQSNSQESTFKPYSVEIDGQTYEASSEEEIKDLINQNIFGDLLGEADESSEEETLPENAIEITDCKGELTKDSNIKGYEFNFTVKNNSDYQFTYLSIECAILDENDTIIDSVAAHLNSTLSSEKKAVLKGSIYELNPEMKKIVIDYAYYDINGDNCVQRYQFDEETISKFPIDIK